MSVAADFYITGVWFDHNGKSDAIKHVYLHQCICDEFLPGVKTDREELISMIHQGRIIRTLVWDHFHTCWTIGPVVSFENRNNITFLRITREEALLRTEDFHNHVVHVNAWV